MSRRQSKPLRNETPSRLLVLQRAQEVVEYLMAHDGFVAMGKHEFAEEMYHHTRRSHWMSKNGNPNRRLVEDVCNLTRDQHDWQDAADALGGYMVTYAPTTGGMTLIGADGDMRLDHLLHMLSGDVTRQQSTKTINRRRIASWKTAAKMALTDGDLDLGLLMGQMESQIDSTGFVSDSLVEEFLKSLSRRGIDVNA